MAMNKKYLVLPAVLAVAAAVAATVHLWPTELKKLREQNLCPGMLTEQTAGLLQDGKRLPGAASRRARRPWRHLPTTLHAPSPTAAALLRAAHAAASSLRASRR